MKKPKPKFKIDDVVYVSWMKTEEKLTPHIVLDTWFQTRYNQVQKYLLIEPKSEDRMILEENDLLTFAKASANAIEEIGDYILTRKRSIKNLKSQIVDRHREIKADVAEIQRLQKMLKKVKKTKN